MRRTLFLLTCALLMLASLPAQANLAAPQRNSAVLMDPGLQGPGTALRVKGEQLAFDCAMEQGLPVCRFTARYVFENPTATRQLALAAFVGVRTTAVEITLDGRAVGRTLSAAEAGRFKGEVVRDDGAVVRAGLDLAVAPHRTALVIVTGRMAPGRYFEPGYDVSAVRTRHLVFGGRPERTNAFHLDYLIAPIRSWGPAPEIAITVRHPARWDLQLACVPSARSSRAARRRQSVDGACPAPRRRREGSSVVQQLTLSGATVDTLILTMQPPWPVLFNGGVLLGIGGNLDDSQGLRVRAGYEIALPRWLFLSLSADTNFRDDLVLAPALEAATSSALFLPSLGLGLGVPVRVVQDQRAGLRAQLTLQWPLLGWVTCFDIYPGAGFAEARHFQVAMLAQLGL